MKSVKTLLVAVYTLCLAPAGIVRAEEPFPFVSISAPDGVDLGSVSQPGKNAFTHTLTVYIAGTLMLAVMPGS